MHGRRPASLTAALAVVATILTAIAPASPAATREPLRDALAPAGDAIAAFDSVARPRPAALRRLARRSVTRSTATAGEASISSGSYGAVEAEEVAATLRSLDHGPELAQLAVYLATPEEIGATCGAAVVACYVPSEREMVVSGLDRAVAGVPRDFAIAHEYGHHLANSRQGPALAAAAAGTLRWATYERVCQLTRRGRLFPGDQGAHYWDDPEEAFAQSYASLNRPDAGIGWQYSELLRPTPASLAKLHADIARPWSGPVETTWSNAVAAPSSVATHRFRTPLDGPVSVSLQASPGAELSIALTDPERDRVLVSATTDASGAATLSYPSCGHDALRLEVRGEPGGGAFQAAITRP